MAQQTEDGGYTPGSFAQELWPDAAPPADAKTDTPEDSTKESSQEVDDKQASKVDGKDDQGKGQEATEDTTAAEGDEDAAVKEESKSEESPKLDWESDDNPWKARAQKEIERQNATQGWANGLNQQLLNLQKLVAIQGKKIDGTFDPEVDKEPTLTPEQQAAINELTGKIAASDAIAYGDKKYGETDGERKARVDQDIREFNTLYGKHQGVQSRILMSPTPTIEALKVMEEHRFFTKYGRDVNQIREAVFKEAEAELRPKITKELEKKFLGRLKAKEDTPEGLNGVRPATGNDTVVEPTETQMLKDAFPNFG